MLACLLLNTPSVLKCQATQIGSDFPIWLSHDATHDVKRDLDFPHREGLVCISIHPTTNELRRDNWNDERQANPHDLPYVPCVRPFFYGADMFGRDDAGGRLFRAYLC